MSLRGILRGFGLKVGHTTQRSFERRIKELVAGHATLVAITTALLSVHSVLAREFRTFEKRVRAAARADTRVRLLTSAPGVGAIVGLTYVCAIDDPSRFKSSRMVGAHFGLTPRKYQSGETDVTGRISKIGDGAVRTALFEAAHIILTRPVKGSSLKGWAAKLAKRAGMKKAKVALARSSPLSSTDCGSREPSLSRRKQVPPFARPLERRRDKKFSGGRDTSLPKPSPVAGTMDQVRPQLGLWRSSE
jgi:transposase